MNVPAMQTLTRMFHEVETSTCQVRKSVRVLHTCDILNFMVDDLHVSKKPLDPHSSYTVGASKRMQVKFVSQ